jgi:hypothetical protein
MVYISNYRQYNEELDMMDGHVIYMELRRKRANTLLIQQETRGLVSHW